MNNHLQPHLFLVTAGAGTGKTRRLIRAYVGSLCCKNKYGVRFTPEHLLALTFTDKAAEEMRERITQVLSSSDTFQNIISELQDSNVAFAPRSIADSFSNHKEQEEHRLRCLHLLPQAPIGTFHAIAQRTLIEHLPNYTSRIILYEEEAKRRLLHIATNTILKMVQNGHGILGNWCARHDIRSFNDARGLAVECVQLRQQALERGLLCFKEEDAISLIHDQLLINESIPRQHLIMSLHNAASILTQIKGNSSSSTKTYREKSAACILAVEWLENLPPPNSEHYEDAVHDLIIKLKKMGIFHRQIYGFKKFPDLAELFEDIRGFCTLWIDAVTQHLMLPEQEGFSELLIQFEKDVRANQIQHAWTDFGAMLIEWWKLLETRPTLRHGFQEKFQRIFVDEFQDTSPLQELILQKLSGLQWNDTHPPEPSPSEHVGELFVVGDPSQSIYGFRGISSHRMEQWRTLASQPLIQKETLDKNFRCGHHILTVANKALTLRRNQLFTALQLQPADSTPQGACHIWTNNISIHQSQDDPSAYHKEHEQEEKEDIDSSENRHHDLDSISVQKNSTILLVKAIQSLLQDGIPENRIAILTRTKHQLNIAVRALQQTGLSTQAHISESLWGYQSIRECLPYIVCALCPTHYDATLGLLHSAFLGWSTNTIFSILAHARTESQQCHFQYLRTSTAWHHLLLPYELSRFHELVEMIQHLQFSFCHGNTHNAFLTLMDKTFLDVWTQHIESPRNERMALSRFFYLCESQSPLSSYHGVNLWEDFHLNRPWYQSNFIQQTSRNGIICTTMHKAKGLEFDHVFIFGLHQNVRHEHPKIFFTSQHSLWVSPIDRPAALWPKLMGKTSVHSALEKQFISIQQEHEAEEERLFYVATTRAKYSLHFIHPQTTKRTHSRLHSLFQETIQSPEIQNALLYHFDDTLNIEPKQHSLHLNENHHSISELISSSIIELSFEQSNLSTPPSFPTKHVEIPTQQSINLITEKLSLYTMTTINSILNNDFINLPTLESQDTSSTITHNSIQQLMDTIRHRFLQWLIEMEPTILNRFTETQLINHFSYQIYPQIDSSLLQGVIHFFKSILVPLREKGWVLHSEFPISIAYDKYFLECTVDVLAVHSQSNFIKIFGCKNNAVTTHLISSKLQLLLTAYSLFRDHVIELLGVELHQGDIAYTCHYSAATHDMWSSWLHTHIHKAF